MNGARGVGGFTTTRLPSHRGPALIDAYRDETFDNLSESSKLCSRLQNS